MFFASLSSWFPSLEDLTLDSWTGCPDIKISSRSLKFISCHYVSLRMASLDVPNVRKIKFISSLHIPLLLFTTDHSRELECEINFVYVEGEVSWFKTLRNPLTELGRSRISLDIKYHCNFVAMAYFGCFPKLVVESPPLQRMVRISLRFLLPMNYSFSVIEMNKADFFEIKMN